MGRLAAGLVALALAGSAGAAGIPDDPRRAPTRVRAAWAELLKIEDGRLAARSCYPYLKNVHGSVRALAARALGRLGDPRARKYLEPVLRSDPDPEVRGEAATALGLLKAPEAVPALVAALEDVGAAAPAARALGLVGSAEGVGALAKVAGDRLLPTEVRAAAYYALGAYPDTPEARGAVPARPPAQDVLAEAASHLVRGMIGEDAPDLPAPWLEAKHPAARRAVMRVLSRKPDAESAARIAALLPGKGEDLPPHEARVLEVAGVGALGRLLDGVGGLQAAGSLAARLNRDDPHVVLAAAEAAAGAKEAPGPVRARLAPGVRTALERGGTHPAVRAALVGALAAVDPEGFAARQGELAGSPAWRVRAAVARVLAAAPPEGLRAERLHARLWDDPDRRVRLACVEAAARREDEAGLDRLRKALDSREPPIVLAAANALAERDGKALAPVLVKLLRRIAVEHHEERAGLVALLAKLEDRVSLQRFRDDEDRLVRAAVRQALGEPPPRPPAKGIAEGEFYLEQLRRYPGRPRLLLETEGGEVEVELEVALAPLTCWNFLSLATTGYFDGLSFHRVVPGFVAQGGDPRGDGFGGPGYLIRCERSLAPYRRGTLGMALAGKDTGGSQFFVTYANFPHLEGGYSVFGRVVEGQDVVDALLPGDRILAVKRLDEPPLEN